MADGGVAPTGQSAKKHPRGAHPVLTWLGRGKLWDDVFSRTVAALITACILGLFALAAGLVHFDSRAWSVLGVVIAGVVMGSAAGISQYRKVLQRGESTRRRKWLAIRTGTIAGLLIAYLIIFHRYQVGRFLDTVFTVR